LLTVAFLFLFVELLDEKNAGLLKALQDVSVSERAEAAHDQETGGGGGGAMGEGNEGGEIRRPTVTPLVKNGHSSASMLHLHRSSKLSNNHGHNQAEESRNTFLSQMQNKVQTGKQDILKRLTVSKTNKTLVKVQPDPNSTPLSPVSPMSPIPPANMTETLPLLQSENNNVSATDTSTTTARPAARGRQTAFVSKSNGEGTPGNALFSPKQGPRKSITKLKSRSGGLTHRKSQQLNESVIAFLNEQLSKNPIPSAPGHASSPLKPAVSGGGGGGSGGGGGRRKSIVLQKLNDVHAAFQPDAPMATAVTGTTTTTGSENQPVHNNIGDEEEEMFELGFIEKYRLYRMEKKRQSRSSKIVSFRQPSQPQKSGSSSLSDRIFHFFYSKPSSISSSHSPGAPTASSSPKHHLITNTADSPTKDVESGPGSEEKQDEKKSETEEDSFHAESLDDFTDIYLFRKPILFYLAVEVCIMFHCLYLAFWMTDFVVISSNIHQPEYWSILTQIAM
jgi:hypothetical protein